MRSSTGYKKMQGQISELEKERRKLTPSLSCGLVSEHKKISQREWTENIAPRAQLHQKKYGSGKE
jgi:hypothetical protein